MSFKSLNFTTIATLLCTLVIVTNGYNPLFLRVYGIDRVDVIQAKQTTDDIYRSFAFLYPNDDIKNYMVSNGIATFMNVSYANLFLRISIDHSFLMVVSDQCNNCDKNILFNISHSLTGDIYNFESDDCWSNLFSIIAANYAKCQVQFNYGKQTITGLLAYETLYLTAFAKNFVIENLVLLTGQDGTLVNSNLNGILGLGRSDIEGSFGFSLFEDFMLQGIIEIPLFSICIEPTGDGYIYFSAYGNGSFPIDESKISWFEQEYSHKYTINTKKISFYDWELKLHKTLFQFTFNSPYLLLSESIFEEFSKQLKKFICSTQSLNAICNKFDDLVNKEDSIEILFENLKILQDIPTLNIDFQSISSTYTLEIKKIFGVCPSENKKYFYSSDKTPVKICSLVRLNKEELSENLIGNIAHSDVGNLYIFDSRAGLFGMAKEALCYTKPDEKKLITFEYSSTYSFVAQVIIIIGFFLLLIFSLNKCDEYFYEEDEIEGEENLLNFLSQGRTENTEHNQTQSASHSQVKHPEDQNTSNM